MRIILDKMQYLLSISFAPDYSANVFAAKICTNSCEHFMYIIFLWGPAIFYFGIITKIS